MSDSIIQVENLSKRYVLSHQAGRGEGLRHVLERQLTAPFEWLRRQTKRASASPDPRPQTPEPTSSEEEFWALKDVSFEVKRGDVVGVIGRNGAGKSTLLKILSRITEPTRGRIALHGRVASLLEVGTGFHPELTGRENIFLNGAILGMSKVEILRKFDEIVAFAEVEKFLDTPVKRYSSGMYVRLAFAVAAHLEPEILVVDEVLAVGDAQFQRKCLGKMQEVSQSGGRTVLFVSHQLASIRRLCNVGLLLTSGTTAGIVPVEQALAEYTKGFSGSVSRSDLRRIPRAGRVGEQTRILDVAAEPQEIRYGEPFRISFVIESSAALQGVTVGVGFDSMDGTRIMTVDSDNSGGTVDLRPGLNEVHLDILRNPLHPAIYSCSAGIMAGRLVVDAVANFATWEIHSGKLDQVSDRGFAGCRPEVQLSN